MESEWDKLHISLVTHIEVSNLWLTGKMRINYPPRRWFHEQVSEWKVSILRLDEEDIFRASELPNYHRDPFDRLLIAQAQLRNMILITPDENIHRYPVSTLW
jgi:PIN domain nuclease of toxin-antitoxin system